MLPYCYYSYYCCLFSLFYTFVLALLPMQHRFYFDQVFGEDSSNEEVYQRTAYPLVQHMLSGYVSTVVVIVQLFIFECSQMKMF